MKETVETGTDVAMICFFDPTALPADIDDKKSLALEKLEKLSEDGVLWFANTGADAAYLFHFYVDEEIPECIKTVSQDPQERNIFHISGGALVACGAEYVSRDPQNSRLAKFPHMGAAFKMPAGDYSVKVWRTEWPDEVIEDAIGERVGRERVTMTRRLGVFTGVLF